MCEADDNLDGEIARCFEPPSDAVERVKVRSLSVRPRRAVGRVLLLAGSVATAGALIAAGVWVRRPVPPIDAEVMTATFEGDVLLLRSASGRAWVVGPPACTAQAPGDWHVTVQGEEK